MYRPGAASSSSRLVLVPADQGPAKVPVTAGAASPSTRSGVAKSSFKKSATHIGATRISSSVSRRPSRQRPSPPFATSQKSPAPAGESGGGGALITAATSGRSLARKPR
jgi:hypothetical protein